jgi:ABC-type polysaccharide/polyol phosphate transport system ATPase subunit
MQTTAQTAESVFEQEIVAPAPAEEDIAIRVSGLGKRYRIYDNQWGRAAEWVSRGHAKCHTDFWAVRGVSFEVRRGECMGILGANGAGKSTLLKIVTGALHATEGSFDVKGRVLSLIELGTGMNPDLTGRQNVFHIARLLAFPPGYAKRKIGDIEAFAEIGAFFDRPVRLYSSGMKARLGFAMFANMQPDVFIVDEVLSVGDVFFRQKCATRLKEMLDEGMTMLFVSHDTGAIEHLCTQGLVLKKGEQAFLGPPDEAIALYHADLHSPKGSNWKRNASAPPANPTARHASNADDEKAILESGVLARARHELSDSPRLRILGVRVANQAGRATLNGRVGDTMTFQLLIEAVEDVEEPSAGILLYDRFNTLLFGGGTRTTAYTLSPMRSGDRMIVRFDVEMAIRAGQYTFHAGVSEPVPGDPEASIRHDLITGLGPIRLMLADGPRTFWGQCELPMKVSHRVCGVLDGAGDA